MVALKFGLWRDRERLVSQFTERLKKDKYRIRCGFLGAPLLCTVLAENGLSELAYDFLLQEGYPGWMYAVNLGATTVWERWNSVGPDGTISNTGMNSLNHYAYGSVMEMSTPSPRASGPPHRASAAPCSAPSRKRAWAGCGRNTAPPPGPMCAHGASGRTEGWRSTPKCPSAAKRS